MKTIAADFRDAFDTWASLLKACLLAAILPFCFGFGVWAAAKCFFAPCKPSVERVSQ